MSVFLLKIVVKVHMVLFDRNINSISFPKNDIAQEHHEAEVV